MQGKSFFLVKNQQVVSWRNGKGRGLTGNVRVIVWNYEENGPGSGDFFETPVRDYWNSIGITSILSTKEISGEALIGIRMQKIAILPDNKTLEAWLIVRESDHGQRVAYRIRERAADNSLVDIISGNIVSDASLIDNQTRLSIILNDEKIEFIAEGYGSYAYDLSNINVAYYTNPNYSLLAWTDNSNGVQSADGIFNDLEIVHSMNEYIPITDKEYSVFGGDSFETNYDQWWLKGYSPENYGYNFLGSANSTSTFYGNYAYYIVNTKAGNVAYVDAVQGSNGIYGNVSIGGNTINSSFVAGPPDGRYAEVGTTGLSDGFIVGGPTSGLDSITVIIDPYGTFRQLRRPLKVQIAPENTEIPGAQWRRTNTTTWRNMDDIESNLLPGEYVVEFKNVAGWITPQNQNVVISDQHSADIFAHYEKITAVPTSIINLLLMD